MNTTLELPEAVFHIADSHPGAGAALEFAQDRHASQRREVDGAPFLIHPVEVASILSEHDYPDHVVTAALLHDVLEKSDTAHDELEVRFGTRVAGLVLALTDNRDRGRLGAKSGSSTSGGGGGCRGGSDLRRRQDFES